MHPAMFLRTALLFLGPLLAAAGVPASGQAAFTRIPAGKATVSLRAEALPPGASTPLWLHLHGATATVEPAFAALGTPGVLVTLTLPGLSKVYADHFADPEAFEGLLRAVTAAVRAGSPGSDWTPGGITLSSFSAGFGGVRQLLRQPAAFNRIATLVMADSIYCGYAGPPEDHRLDAALITPPGSDPPENPVSFQ
ncbi:MAG: hypothetical protein ACKOE8_06650 [Opitutaceae bacterium]